MTVPIATRRNAAAFLYWMQTGDVEAMQAMLASMTDEERVDMAREAKLMLGSGGELGHTEDDLLQTMTDLAKES